MPTGSSDAVLSALMCEVGASVLLPCKGPGLEESSEWDSEVKRDREHASMLEEIFSHRGAIGWASVW